MQFAATDIVCIDLRLKAQNTLFAITIILNYTVQIQIRSTLSSELKINEYHVET